jgi:hypothetical protein
VREVIGKRLSQLGEDTNDVLSVAAVIGPMTAAGISRRRRRWTPRSSS